MNKSSTVCELVEVIMELFPAERAELLKQAKARGLGGPKPEINTDNKG